MLSKENLEATIKGYEIKLAQRDKPRRQYKVKVNRTNKRESLKLMVEKLCNNDYRVLAELVKTEIDNDERIRLVRFSKNTLKGPSKLKHILTFILDTNRKLKKGDTLKEKEINKAEELMFKILKGVDQPNEN